MDLAELVTILRGPDPMAEMRPAGPLRSLVHLTGQGRTITLFDRQPFTKGSYFAWLAPWGAGSLQPGKDYTESLTLDPETFPARTQIRWSWPAQPPAMSMAGVYNFLAVSFGDQYGTQVQAPIPPRQVAAITALTQTHDLAIEGAPDGFDVVVDYFLTREAGKHDVHLFEVEIFLHTPAFSHDYVRSVEQVGTFTDRHARTWTVAINRKNGHGPAILFMPVGREDVLRDTIDIQAMHIWLMARGVLSGREWFNGLGLGAEVRQGNGLLVIKHFSVDYR
jgi:hypothetical protein